MKLVFQHENPIIVGNIKNILENIGVKTQLRNEYIGGAAGELPPTDTAIELWVVNDRDEERALSEIDNINFPSSSIDWYCKKCGEVNAAAFEVCWNCGSERPDIA